MPRSSASSFGPPYASPVDLISRTTLTVATAQVDMPAASTYRHLTLYWTGQCSAPNSSYVVSLRVNNSSTAAYSGNMIFLANQGSVVTPNSFTAQAQARVGVVGSGTGSPSITSSGVVEFPNWGSTTGTLNFLSRGTYYESASNTYFENAGWQYIQAGPYTAINLFVSSGYNWSVGSTFSLYGYS